MKLTAHPLAELPRVDASGDTPVNQSLVLRLRLSLAQTLARDNQLAVTFYQLLFSRYPHLRGLFPNDMRHQHLKLTHMLVWMVTHLEDRNAILPAFKALGQRHAKYGARVEHFPIVRDTLIDAMGTIASDEWNDSLAEDWRLTLDLIARHMLSGVTADVT